MTFEVLPPCGECDGCRSMSELKTILEFIDRAFAPSVESALEWARRLPPGSPEARDAWRNFRKVQAQWEEERGIPIKAYAQIIWCEQPRYLLTPRL